MVSLWRATTLFKTDSTGILKAVYGHPDNITPPDPKWLSQLVCELGLSRGINAINPDPHSNGRGNYMTLDGDLDNTRSFKSGEVVMSKSIMDLVAEAKRMVPSISPEELKSIWGQDKVLVVDVRDAPELADTGKIQGALNVSRGMLEFRADETTPYYNEAFSKDKTVVLYCATGGRSALGGKALMELGYQDVRTLGAFKDWIEAGGAIEKP